MQNFWSIPLYEIEIKLAAFHVADDTHDIYIHLNTVEYDETANVFSRRKRRTFKTSLSLGIKLVTR